jgi:hypothetical protein
VKLTPKDFLDIAVVLIGLLVCTIVIAVVDHVEARLISSGHVSVVSANDAELPMSSLDRGYLILRNSMRRWLFFYLPTLSLIGGVTVGFACSGFRRAWVIALIALSLIPAMAVAFLLDTPLVAAVAAGVYVMIVATAATGSALFLHLRPSAVTFRENQNLDQPCEDGTARARAENVGPTVL